VLIEMYLAGVSVRRVEDITEVLWGKRLGAHEVIDYSGLPGSDAFPDRWTHHLQVELRNVLLQAILLADQRSEQLEQHVARCEAGEQRGSNLSE
jgi:hypothetical protein